MSHCKVSACVRGDVHNLYSCGCVEYIHHGLAMQDYADVDIESRPSAIG